MRFGIVINLKGRKKHSGFALAPSFLASAYEVIE